MQTRDPAIVAITNALAQPFEPREVKFKPQMVKNNRCLAMAYIDARLIQERLDEVLGPENWEDSYRLLPDGSAMCRLRVRLGDRWVTKTDVGSPSEQPDSGDRIKAAISDSLKRAAVKFGIGRYLYRLPASWVDYDPVKKQIVQPPQLPAFAIPKKPPAQSKPAEAKVATVATPPSGKKADAEVAQAMREKEIPKEQLDKNMNDTKEWLVLIQSEPDIDSINQALPRIKQMADAVAKVCWVKTKEYAAKCAWRFNDVSKKFEASNQGKANA